MQAGRRLLRAMLLSALAAATPARADLIITSDPAVRARLESGELDEERLLAQAYRLHADGRYAEAGEIFRALVEREAAANQGGPRLSEYLLNQALQYSNRGNYPAADALFAGAASTAALADPVLGRRLRNGYATHYLNQKKLEEAVAELNKPIADMPSTVHVKLKSGEIDATIADAMNGGNNLLAGRFDGGLTPTELAQMLDAQALHLRGVAYRIHRDYAQARVSFDDAVKMADAIRGGRLDAAAGLRSMIKFDLAMIARAEGNMPEAEKLLVAAVQETEARQPNTATALAARARLAGFYAGAGRIDRAMTIFAEVIAAAEKVPGAMTTINVLLGPYRQLIAERSRGHPKAVAPETPGDASKGH